MGSGQSNFLLTLQMKVQANPLHSHLQCFLFIRVIYDLQS